MTPQAREIIRNIAMLHGVDAALILSACRKQKVFRARMAVAKQLYARGYSTSRIGAILNKDHTAIVFYLGRAKKKPSPLRWRKPRIRTLLVVKKKPPKEQQHRYLKPYAGADFTEYKWQERRV